MEKQEDERLPLVDRLWKTHLEVDISEWEQVTHKKIGDNLRCYPIIIVFAVAIAYLWDASIAIQYPAFVGKAAACVWALWLFWFGTLTVIQTTWLFANFLFNLIGLKENATTQSNVNWKIFFLLISIILSGLFIVGAVDLVLLIYTKTPKYS